MAQIIVDKVQNFVLTRGRQVRLLLRGQESTEWKGSKIQLRVTIMKADIPNDIKLALSTMIDESMERIMRQFLEDPEVSSLKKSFESEGVKLASVVSCCNVSDYSEKSISARDGGQEDSPMNLG